MMKKVCRMIILFMMLFTFSNYAYAQEEASTEPTETASTEPTETASTEPTETASTEPTGVENTILEEDTVMNMCVRYTDNQGEQILNIDVFDDETIATINEDAIGVVTITLNQSMTDILDLTQLTREIKVEKSDEVTDATIIVEELHCTGTVTISNITIMKLQVVDGEVVFENNQELMLLEESTDYTINLQGTSDIVYSQVKASTLAVDESITGAEKFVLQALESETVFITDDIVLSVEAETGFIQCGDGIYFEIPEGLEGLSFVGNETNKVTIAAGFDQEQLSIDSFGTVEINDLLFLDRITNSDICYTPIEAVELIDLANYPDIAITIITSETHKVVLVNSNENVVLEGGYAILKDETAIIDGNLPYTNTRIEMTYWTVGEIEYLVLVYEDMDNGENVTCQYISGSTTDIIFVGNEQDNKITFETVASFNGTITIRGGDGTDELILGAIQNETLDLILESDEIKTSGTSSEQLSITVRNLNVQGETKSFISEYVDYIVKEDMDIGIEETIESEKASDFETTIGDAEILTSNLTIELTNGDYQIDGDFNASTTLVINVEGDSGSFYAGSYISFLSIVLDQINLWAQGAISIKTSNKTSASLNTGNGASEFGFILVAGLLESSIEITNTEGYEIKGDTITIHNENSYTGNLQSDPSLFYDDDDATSGTFIVVGVMDQEAKITVDSKMTATEDVSITSELTHISSMTAKSGNGEISSEAEIDQIGVLFDTVQELVGLEGNTAIDTIQSIWTAVMKLNAIVDDYITSFTDYFGNSEGQVASSIVLNIANLTNEISVASDGISCEDLIIQANRVDDIDIYVDGSALDGSSWGTAGKSSSYAIGIVNIDQVSELQGTVTAKNITVESNATDTTYTVDVKGGYELEQNGTGSTILGVVANISNQASIESGSTLNIEESLIVKASGNYFFDMEDNAAGDEEQGTFGSATGFALIVNEVIAKISSGVTMGRTYESLTVVAESDVTSQLDVIAGGNGGNASAPGMAINVLINLVSALVENSSHSVTGDIEVSGKSDTAVLSTVTSKLMEGVAGKGSSLIVNVQFSDVDTKVSSAVSCKNFTMTSRNTVRSEFVAVASPDGELEDLLTEDEDDNLFEIPDPVEMVNNVKDSITESFNSVVDSIENFSLGDMVLDLFDGEVETTEGTVNSTSALGINFINGDNDNVMDGSITATGNVYILSEVALNVFGFSYSNTELPTEGDDPDKAGAAGVTTAVIFFDSNTNLNGEIISAQNVTVETTTVDVYKRVLVEDGDVTTIGFGTNDTNSLIFMSTSGAASGGKSTSGSINVLYLDQSFITTIRNSVNASGTLTVQTIIDESISAEAYATASHDFGITFAWKGTTKGTGMSIGVNIVNSTVTAAIYALPSKQISIQAKALNINSIYKTDLTAYAEAGGEGSATGANKVLDAAVAVNYITSKVYAYAAADEITITNGNLVINAEYSGSTDTKVEGIATGGTSTKGGAVSYLYFETDTKAYIDSAKAVVNGDATITALNSIYHDIYAEATAEGSILSDYQNVFNVTAKTEISDIAKGKGSNSSLSGLANKITGSTQGTTLSAILLGKADVSTPETTNQDGTTNKSSQVSISAALAVLMLENTTEAYTNGSLQANNVTVLADTASNYHIELHGTSVANGTSVTMVVGVLLSNNTTTAHVDNINATGDLSVTAEYTQNADDPYIDTLSIEAYGTAKSGVITYDATSGKTIAGTGVYLESTDVTKAYIETGAVVTADEVTILAEEKSKYAIRAVAYSKSSEDESGGAGIAFAMLNIENELQAYVDDNVTLTANELTITTSKPNINDDQETFEWLLEWSDFDIYDEENEAIKTDVVDNITDKIEDMLDWFTMHNFYIDVFGGANQGSDGNLAGSGSVAVLLFNDTNASYIGEGCTINVTGDILLESIQDQSIQMLSGSFSKSGKTAIGLNAMVLLNGSSTSVYIGQGSKVEVGGDLTLTASDEKEFLLVSAVGSLSSSTDGTTTTSVAGSVNVIMVENTVYAGIGKNSATSAEDYAAIKATSVTVGGDMNLTATMVNEIIDAMLGIVSGSTGVGASVSFIDVESLTQASIEEKSTVNASGDIIIFASSEEDIKVFLLAAQYAEKFSFAGNVAYKNIYSTTIASVEQGSVITCDTLDVQAHSDTVMWGIVGNISLSKESAAGGASDVNTYSKTVSAIVDVDSLTIRENLIVKATDSNFVFSVVAGMGVGGDYGITGSIPVILVENTVTAKAVATTKIDVTGDIYITIDQIDDISVYAGTVAGGSKVAIGAAVTTITNSGTSTVLLQAPTVNAKNITMLNAKSTDVLVGSVSGSASGKVSVVGVVVTIVNDATVGTEIGEGTIVVATGDVILSATSDSTYDTYIGALSIGGSVAVGASVLTLVSESNTTTAVGEGAKITSAGSIVNVAKSQNEVEAYIIGIAASGSTSVNGAVATILFENTTAIENYGSMVAENAIVVLIGNDQDIIAVLGNGSGSGTVAVSPSVLTMINSSITTATFTGDTITANGNSSYTYGNTNYQGFYLENIVDTEYDFIVVAIAGSGSASVTANVLVILLENQVSTSYDGVTLQVSDFTSKVDNDISLAASVGAIAISGSAAVVPGVIYANSNSVITQSFVSGSLQSANDIVITTNHDASYTGHVVGIAVSGSVSVNAIANVFMINDTVKTEVKHAMSGRNITVTTINTMENDVMTAVLAGSGTAAVGAASSTLVMESTIVAYVSNVIATGDVVVLANSSEDITLYAAGIAVAGTVAVAGSVVVLIFDNTIYADVVGSNGLLANNLTIDAKDTFDVSTLAGSVSGGYVGVGAAVAVMLVNNDMHAKLTMTGSGTVANALTVMSTSERNIEAVVISGTAGVVAVSGSVLVLQIGDALDATATAQLNIDNQSQLVTIEAELDALKATEIDGKATDDNAASKVASMNNSVVSATQVADSSDMNQAIISGGTITAKTVVVQAVDKVIIDVDNGAVGVGAVSVGGAVSVITFNNQVSSKIENATIDASDVTVSSDAIDHSYTVDTIGGGVSGISVSGMVTLFTVTNVIEAVTDDATIKNANITISAQLVPKDAILTSLFVGKADLGAAVIGASVLKYDFATLVQSVYNGSFENAKTILISTNVINTTDLTAYAAAGGAVVGTGFDFDLILRNTANAIVEADGSATSIIVKNNLQQDANITVEKVSVAGIDIGVVLIDFNNSSVMNSSVNGLTGLTLSGNLDMDTTYNTNASYADLGGVQISTNIASGGLASGGGLTVTVNEAYQINNQLAGVVAVAGNVDSDIYSRIDVSVTNESAGYGVITITATLTDINITATVNNFVASDANIDAYNLDLLNHTVSVISATQKGTSAGALTITVNTIDIAQQLESNVYIGEGATITATNDVNLNNYYNVDLNNNLAVMPNTGTTAQNNASAGGVISASGTVTNISQSTKIRTYVSKNGKVYAGNAIAIEGQGDFYTSFSHASDNYGVVPVGVNTVSIINNAVVETSIQTSARLESQSVALMSYGVTSTIANTQQNSGGVVSVTVNSITITETDLLIQTVIGSNAVIQAQGDVLAIAMLTKMYTLGISGADYGLVTVGTAQISVDTTSNVKVLVEDNAKITTDGTVYINAFGTISGYNITVYASGGSLVGVNSTNVSFSDTMNVVVNIYASASIDADQITIMSNKSITNVIIESVAVYNGLIVAGTTVFDASFLGSLAIVIGDGVALTAQNDVGDTDSISILCSMSVDSIYVCNYAGIAVSLASANTTSSTLTVTVQPSITIGNLVTMNTDGSIGIYSQVDSLVLDCRAKVPDVTSALTANYVNATITLSLGSNIYLGNGSEYIAKVDITILTVIRGVSLYTDTWAKVYALDSYSHAKSIINIGTVNVTISGSNVILSASQDLNIQTYVSDDFTAHAKSYSTIAGGLTGKVYSTSTVDVVFNNAITLLGTSELVGTNIYICADTLTQNNSSNFNRDATSYSASVVHTVTRAIETVLEVITSVTEKICSWLPWPFSSIVKWIVKTVVTLVTVIVNVIETYVLGSDEQAYQYGSFASSSTVNLGSATIKYGTTVGIDIVIDASGNVVGIDSQYVVVDGNTITITEFGMLSGGSCRIYSQVGYVYGDFTVVRNIGVTKLNITNNSDYDLYLGALALDDGSSDEENAEYLISSYMNSDGSYSYTVSESNVYSDSTQLNLTISSNGSGDIYFTGKVYLPSSSIQITTQGSIYTTGEAAIYTYALEIAAAGNVGSTDNAFVVYFVPNGMNSAELQMEAASVNMIAQLYNEDSTLTSTSDLAMTLSLTIKKLIVTDAIQLVFPEAVVTSGTGRVETQVEIVSTVETKPVLDENGDEIYVYYVLVDENGELLVDGEGNYVYGDEKILYTYEEITYDQIVTTIIHDVVSQSVSGQVIFDTAIQGESIAIKSGIEELLFTNNASITTEELCIDYTGETDTEFLSEYAVGSASNPLVLKSADEVSAVSVTIRGYQEVYIESEVDTTKLNDLMIGALVIEGTHITILNDTDDNVGTLDVRATGNVAITTSNMSGQITGNTLVAHADTVGTEANALDITIAGPIEMQVTDSIYINSTSSMQIQQLIAQNVIAIKGTEWIACDTEDIHLQANQLDVILTGDMGSAGAVFNTSVNQLDITATNIYFNNNKALRIENLEATQVIMTVDGVVTMVDETSLIIAEEFVFSNTADASLVVNVSDFNVATAGNLEITNNNTGNTIIRKITADKTAKLTFAGNITCADEDALITVESLVLKAQEIDVNTAVRNLDVTGTDITLDSMLADAVTIERLYAEKDITATFAGSVVSEGIDAVSITAQGLVLDAVGDIGTRAVPLLIEIDELTVESDADIYLKSNVSDTVIIHSIATPEGLVVLEFANATVVADEDTDYITIQADTLDGTIGASFGTEEQLIRLNVNTIETLSADQIYISNTKSVVIDQMVAVGTIQLDIAGNVTKVDDESKLIAETLNASVVGNVDLNTNISNLTLEAGDNVILVNDVETDLTIVELTANTKVNVTAGNMTIQDMEVDKENGVITLDAAGNISADAIVSKQLMITHAVDVDVVLEVEQVEVTATNLKVKVADSIETSYFTTSVDTLEFTSNNKVEITNDKALSIVNVEATQVVMTVDGAVSMSDTEASITSDVLVFSNTADASLVVNVSDLEVVTEGNLEITNNNTGDTIVQKITADKTAVLVFAGNIECADEEALITVESLYLEAKEIDVNTAVTNLDVTGTNITLDSIVTTDVFIQNLESDAAITATFAGSIYTVDEEQAYITAQELILDVNGSVGSTDTVMVILVEELTVESQQDVYLKSVGEEIITVHSILAKNGMAYLDFNEASIEYIESKNLALIVHGDFEIGNLNIYERVILKVEGDVTVLDEVDETQPCIRAQYLEGIITGDFGTSENEVTLELDQIDSFTANQIFVSNSKSLAIDEMLAVGTIQLEVAGDVTKVDEDSLLTAKTLIGTVTGDVDLITNISNLTLDAGDKVVLVNDVETDLMIEALTANAQVQITAGNITAELIVADQLIITDALDVDVVLEVERVEVTAMSLKVEVVDAIETSYFTTSIDTLDFTSDKNVEIKNDKALSIVNLEAAQVVMRVDGIVSMSDTEASITSDVLVFGNTADASLVVNVSDLTVATAGNLELTNNNEGDTIIREITADKTAELTFAGNIRCADENAVITVERLVLKAQEIDVNTAVRNLDVTGTNITLDSLLTTDVCVQNLKSDAAITATFAGNIIAAGMDTDEDAVEITAQTFVLNTNGSIGSDETFMTVAVEELTVEAQQDVYLNSLREDKTTVHSVLATNGLVVLDFNEVDIEYMEAVNSDLIVHGDLAVGNLEIDERITLDIEGDVSVLVEIDTAKPSIKAQNMEAEIDGDFGTNEVSVVLELDQIDSFTANQIFVLNTKSLVIDEMVASDMIQLEVAGDVTKLDEESLVSVETFIGTVEGNVNLITNISNLTLDAGNQVTLVNDAETDLMIAALTADESIQLTGGNITAASIVANQLIITDAVDVDVVLEVEQVNVTAVNLKAEVVDAIETSYFTTSVDTLDFTSNNNVEITNDKALSIVNMNAEQVIMAVDGAVTMVDETSLIVAERFVFSNKADANLVTDVVEINLASNGNMTFENKNTEVTQIEEILVDGTVTMWMAGDVMMKDDTSIIVAALLDIEALDKTITLRTDVSAIDAAAKNITIISDDLDTLTLNVLSETLDLTAKTDVLLTSSSQEELLVHNAVIENGNFVFNADADVVVEHMNVANKLTFNVAGDVITSSEYEKAIIQAAILSGTITGDLGEEENLLKLEVKSMEVLSATNVYITNNNSLILHDIQVAELIDLTVDGDVSNKSEGSITVSESLRIIASGDIELQTNVSNMNLEANKSIVIANDKSTDLYVEEMKASESITLTTGNLNVDSMETKLLHILGANTMEATTDIEQLILEEVAEVVLNNEPTHGLFIGTAEVDNTLEINAGTITYDQVTAETILLNITGKLSPESASSLISGNVLEVVATGTMNIYSNVATATLTTSSAINLKNKQSIVLDNVSGSSLTMDVSGDIGMLNASSVLTAPQIDITNTGNAVLNINASMLTIDAGAKASVQQVGSGLLTVTSAVSGVSLVIISDQLSLNTVTTDSLTIQTSSDIDFTGEIYSVDIQAGDVRIENQGSLVGEIDAQDFAFLVQGNVNLALMVNEVSGTATGDIILTANNLSISEGNTIEGASVYLDVVETLQVLGGLVAQETNILLAKDNVIYLDGQGGNTVLTARNVTTVSDIKLDGFNQLLEYIGGTRSDNIELELQNVNGARINIDGSNSTDTLSVDTGEASGTFTMNVNETEMLNVFTSSLADSYTFDVSGMEVVNEISAMNMYVDGTNYVVITDDGGNNDAVFVDTFATIDVDFGDGNNDVTIGTLERTSSKSTGAAVSSDGIVTTVGTLSKGNSYPLTIRGGGSNNYTIYHTSDLVTFASSAGENNYSIHLFVTPDYEPVQQAEIIIEDGTGSSLVTIMKTNFLNKFEEIGTSIFGEGLNLTYSGDVTIEYSKSSDGKMVLKDAIIYSFVSLYRNYFLVVVGLILLGMGTMMWIYSKKRKKKSVIK